MPELPEVEVLVRHLRPRLLHQPVRSVAVRRARFIRPTSIAALRHAMVGASFSKIVRQGKYLVFTLYHPHPKRNGFVTVLAHLGMTGRIYLQPHRRALPRHAAVVMTLSSARLVFEDTRYFGRLTLDLSPLARLGPEPLSARFSIQQFTEALRRSQQPIKCRLLDQSVAAGVGNIYAAEALFLARINPTIPAARLTTAQIRALHRAIRAVLRAAIRYGSTVPLDWAGTGQRDGVFYYGRTDADRPGYQERLRVYDRAGQPCVRCGTHLQRIQQAGRGTFFRPRCQRVGRQPRTPHARQIPC
jgi:formamidopyrimidine-DNA glycosylase